MSKVYNPSDTDVAYVELERAIQTRVDLVTQEPLFTTDVDPDKLFEAYLEGIGIDRQHYNCNSCKKFIRNFGGLVTIDDFGLACSAMWFLHSHEAPPMFYDSLRKMRTMVHASKVTGVHYNGEAVWGQPKTGEWTHLSGINRQPYEDPLLTADQRMAERRTDYNTLSHGLSEVTIEVCQQAVRVLKAEAVSRSEKALAIAEWLLALKERTETIKNKKNRENVVWRAVALAPSAFCHIRSTMINTLIDDILAGLPFEVIRRKWNEKVHPLQYQRPTTISSGNIKQAEEIIERLGAKEAMKRRFAKVEEIQAIWRPTAYIDTPKQSEGVFGHLLKGKKEIYPVLLPTKDISWEKFYQRVLTTASDIWLVVPGGIAMPFFGMITAVDLTAAPLMQWDTDPRNPFSWYFYHPGSNAYQWNLTPGDKAKVTAICHKPCHWYHPELQKHVEPSAFFVLEGCVDTKYDKGGLFFPESLRSEFHSIRSSMEAFSKEGSIEGKTEGTANGLAFTRREYPIVVQVKSASGLDTYRINRWE